MAEALPDANVFVVVYDSGVGGLGVLQECLISAPGQRFLYVSDDGGFPYAAQSVAAVRDRVSAMLAAIAVRPRALVLAGGIVSAVVAEDLRRRFPTVPVVDLASHQAAQALTLEPHRRVGLLASSRDDHTATIRDLIRDGEPGVEFEISSSTEVAAFVQRGGPRDELVVRAVERAVRPLRDAAVEVVIVNCSHTLLVADVARRHLGRGIALVDAREAVAGDLVRHIPRNSGASTCEFWTSGHPDRVRSLVIQYLQWPEPRVVHVDP